MYSLCCRPKGHIGPHLRINAVGNHCCVLKASSLFLDTSRTRWSGVRFRESSQHSRKSSGAARAAAGLLAQSPTQEATNQYDDNYEGVQAPSEIASRVGSISDSDGGDLTGSQSQSPQPENVSNVEQRYKRHRPGHKHEPPRTGESNGIDTTDPYLYLTDNQEYGEPDGYGRRQCVEATEGNEIQSSFFTPPKLSRHGSGQAETSGLIVADRVRPKVDLSYQNVRDREAAVAFGGMTTALYSDSPSFRDRLGMRRIVAAYMRHVENIATASNLTAKDGNEVDYRVLQVFTDETLTYLRNHGYAPEDVVSLSWIFSASDICLSIRRYVTLSAERRQQGSPAIPLFVPLQLLRAPGIDAHALSILITEVHADLEKDCRWNQDSGPVLLIRLLRIARTTEVSLFERIIDLAPRVVSLALGKHPDADVERLTHFYNRLLSLVALPISRHPYLSAIYQQRAQLKIVKLIMQSDSPVSLNREGYRALIKVQQLHGKTVEEQKWSSVKAPSWPPWRIDDLGIDSRIEYSGRHSRVSKVLKRFLEAGYGPASTEEEAQILAGWDIDKSPTIQVRRIVKRQPLSWIKNVFKSDRKEQTTIDHNVWAARVAATRSIREAWVCFYSYMNATQHQKRHLMVYHEMFFKLFARSQQSDPKLIPSPGDGKEVFADPISARDLVYVPKEPPSLSELYAQMLEDDIRPAGRLLAGLVSHANTLKEALSYIAGSSMDDVKKDVLLHAEKYPNSVIRHTFSRCPGYLLSSYVGTLMRRIPHDGMRLYEPGSRSVDKPANPKRDECTPLQYGLQLFKIWEPAYLPAYHMALHGLYTHSTSKEMVKGVNTSIRVSIGELWEAGSVLLKTLEHQNLTPDLECFRKATMLIRNLIVRTPRKAKATQISIYEMVQVPVSLFAQAVWEQKSGIHSLPAGKDIKTWRQPYWKDVENLLLMLGLIQDFPSITEVLRWMSDEHEKLACVDGGGYKTQRLMCAARVALEGTWDPTKSRCASQEQINQAVKYAERWGWPEDVDVHEFLQQHWAWLKNAARHL